MRTSSIIMACCHQSCVSLVQVTADDNCVTGLSSYLSVEVGLEVDAVLCSEVKWSTDWGLWCNIANIGRYYHNG